MKLSRNFKVLPPTSWMTSRRAVALKNLSKFRKPIDSLIHGNDAYDDDDVYYSYDYDDHHQSSQKTITITDA